MPALGIRTFFLSTLLGLVHTMGLPDGRMALPCASLPAPEGEGIGMAQRAAPPSAPSRCPRAAPGEPAASSQPRWIGSIQGTDSGFSAGSMSRLIATASPSLRTSTHSSVWSALALISWCGTKGGT